MGDCNVWGELDCYHANPTHRISPGLLHGGSDYIKKKKKVYVINLNCYLFIKLTLKIKLPSILPVEDGFIQEEPRTTTWGQQAMAKP